MHFPRTKLVSQFRELFLNNTAQYFALIGELGVGKTTFIDILKKSDVFLGFSIESLFVDAGHPLSGHTEGDQSSHLIIIDTDGSLDFDTIRTFIEGYSPDSRVIYTSRDIYNTPDEVVRFQIPGISFREFAEGNNTVIDIGSLMQENSLPEDINELRDTYIHRGHMPTNLIYPENIPTTFSNILTIMNQELFKKEEGDFLEFIRTVAMNVGDIFKEDRIGNTIGLSRRKIRKYTEIILKHNLVQAVGPWVQDETTESTRHVKLYFNDLACFHEALGVGYYHGEGKQGVLENFILLELKRKLDATHEIRFYRKKSKAEVSFILVNKETEKITPIDITPRTSEIIPLALKIFLETYPDKIEYAMVMNESIAKKKTLNNTTILFLPHIAI